MPSRALAREIRVPAAVALVVGQVIAVGIFLTPATIIRGLASPFWIVVLWTAMGMMAICGALVYGALAARFPDAGGGYVYLREAYGPRVAFLYGWKCFLIMDPGITAALATGFAAYARHVVPMGAVGTRLTAIFAIAGLALVHVVGVRPGTRMLAALALLKIVLIAGLVVAAFGSQAGDWAHFLPLIERHPMAPPFAGAFAGAFVAAFFSFGGWWEVTKIAGEVADPVHTLPRALWVGLFTVTLLYLGTTLAFIYVVPIDAVVPGEAFGAQVGGVILGAGGDTAIAAIVMVCVLGSLAAILMMAPRLYFAMAKDGLFPAAAAAVHPSFGTPARSIVMQATLASILVGVGTFDSIVSYFVFITVAFIALTVTSVFRLKREQPAWHVPGYPWTPVIFLLMVGVLLVLMAVNSPRQALLGTAIVVLGLPVYRLIARGDLIQTP